MKKFIRNINTKQIHRQPLTPQCNVVAENPRHRPCGALVAWFMLTFAGYDGCAWCYPEKHDPERSNS